MNDPFEALHEPYVPVTPDPQFAARLRAQLERALLAPTGDTMSTSTTTVQLQHGDISSTSLWTPDVDLAAAFYGSVLDWQYASTDEPQGRQVTGLSQHIGMWGDQDHSTMSLCFVVDDIVAATDRVRAAGGQAADPSRQSYGFVSQCTDDQGLVFAVAQEPADHRTSIAPSPGPGEIAYLTIGVPDTARFRAFFGSVLGWQFTPGRVDDGWNVLNDGEQVQPMTGLIGGHDRATVTPMFQVRDVAAAVARVRAAGGTSTEPAQQPYGTTAECTDDQGGAFYLGQV